MAPPQPRRSMSEYYLNEYFKTHEKRMQESIALAQAELQTRMKLLQYYDRQLKQLDEKQKIVEKTKLERQKKVVKTGGVDKFKRELAVAKLKDSRAEAEARAEQRAEASVNADFDITRFDVGGIGRSMEDDLRAGADQSLTLSRAINRVGGNAAGSSPLQRIIIGKALLLQADRAKRVVGGVPFDRGSAKADIASGLGISASDLDKPDATLRRQEVTRRTKKPDFGDVPSITQPGAFETTTTTFPAETTKTTTTTKGKVAGQTDPDPSAAEQKAEKELLASIIANRKKIEKMKADVVEAIERDTGTDLDFERLLERGRDIYRRKYAPMSGEQRRATRQQEIIRGMTPTQQEMYGAFNKWRSGFTAISPEALDSIIERMNTPITDADDIAFKTAKEIVDQRAQGVEFPKGVYKHILGVVNGDEELANTIASYVILQKKKPSKAQKTMSEEINDVLRDTPGKITQTFDALKALNEGMDLEALSQEEKQIVIDKLQAQGIDASELIVKPKPVKGDFDIPQDILGGSGQGQVNMLREGRADPFPLTAEDVGRFFNIVGEGVGGFFTETVPDFFTGKTKEEREKEAEEKKKQKKKVNEPPKLDIEGVPGFRLSDEGTMEGYKARLRYMFGGRVSEAEIDRLAELYGPGSFFDKGDK